MGSAVFGVRHRAAFDLCNSSRLTSPSWLCSVRLSLVGQDVRLGTDWRDVRPDLKTQATPRAGWKLCVIRITTASRTHAVWVTWATGTAANSAISFYENPVHAIYDNKEAAIRRSTPPQQPSLTNSSTDNL